MYKDVPVSKIVLTCLQFTIHSRGATYMYGDFNGNFFVFLAHLSRWLIGELLVYSGIRRPSVVRRQHFQTTSSLKPLCRFFSYFIYSIYR